MSKKPDRGSSHLTSRQIWSEDNIITITIIIVLVGNALILLDSWPLKLLSLSSAYFLVGGLAVLTLVIGFLMRRRSS